MLNTETKELKCFHEGAIRNVALVDGDRAKGKQNRQKKNL